MEIKLKQEEQAELIKFLGLESHESLEQAKEAFESKFIKSEELTSKIGKITGSIQNTAKKLFEPFGVSLSDEDFKEKKVEEVLKFASEKAKESYTAKVTELEKRASGNANDEVIKEWEGKYTKLEKQLQEQSKAREEAVSAFDNFKAEIENKEKNNKRKSFFEEQLSAVKLDPTASPIALKGFKSHIDENYLIDMEGENFVVKSKKTGELIKNEKKAGEFLNLKDILTKEATELNLIMKSSDAGKQRQGGANGGRRDENDKPKTIPGLSPRFATRI
jgi:hypothetical protein